MVEELSNPIIKFTIVHNAEEPINLGDLMTCAKILQGDKMKFGVGARPINPGGARSIVTKAIGEDGTEAVMKTLKTSISTSGQHSYSEAGLFRLANEAGIDAVPRLLGQGEVGYDPIDHIFTDDTNQVRPYLLVKDVLKNSEPKEYEDLSIKEQTAYLRKEYEVFLELLNKTGICFRDFDDVVFFNRRDGKPSPKFFDFSEEKHKGVPIPLDLTKKIINHYHQHLSGKNYPDLYKEMTPEREYKNTF